MADFSIEIEVTNPQQIGGRCVAKATATVSYRGRSAPRPPVMVSFDVDGRRVSSIRTTAGGQANSDILLAGAGSYSIGAQVGDDPSTHTSKVVSVPSIKRIPNDLRVTVSPEGMAEAYDVLVEVMDDAGAIPNWPLIIDRGRGMERCRTDAEGTCFFRIQTQAPISGRVVAVGAKNLQRPIPIPGPGGKPPLRVEINPAEVPRGILAGWRFGATKVKEAKERERSRGQN